MLRKAAVVVALAALLYWWLNALLREAEWTALRTPPQLRPEGYDYVVIGAGSAGAIVAARLSEDPSVSVLLMEAGGPPDVVWYSHVPALVPFLPRSTLDWNYLTVPQRHCCNASRQQRLSAPRGRTLGGTSVLNYMMFVRAVEEDHRRWAHVHGATGWHMDDVIDHYRRLETVHFEPTNDETRGRNGPIHVTIPKPTPFAEAIRDAAKAVKFGITDDYNSRLPNGFGFTQKNIYRGHRQSTAETYLKPAMKRDNLHILTNSQATKIEFDESKTIQSVRYRFGNEEHSVNVKRELILSGGAYGSPQLLMLSGIGPAAELKRLGIPVVVDSPEVGAVLHDHPFFYIRGELNDTDAIGDAAEMQSGLFDAAKAYLRYFTSEDGDGALGRVDTEVTIRVHSGLSTKQHYMPDLQLIAITSDCVTDFAENYNLKPEVAEAGVRAKGGGIPFIWFIALLHPFSRGTLKLESDDPFAQPRIDPNLFEKQVDVNILIAGTKMVRNIMKAAPLQKYNPRWTPAEPDHCSQYREWSDTWLACLIRFRSSILFHPTSTCRMGANITDAVVDSELRVFGVHGVRVADASIFPDIPSGNTNVPTMMVGEKAADLIKAARRESQQ